MSQPTQSGRAGRFSRVIRSSLVCYPLYAIVGVLLIFGVSGGFTTAVEATNSVEFCTSCHDMRYNYEEYKKTTHYSNRSGVRALCSDCHVPKRDWFALIGRKLEAAHDVWGEIIGVIDTREKYEAHRLEMAKREWARMKASDSIGCRNCHSFEAMKIEGQDKLAGKKHSRVMEGSLRDKTCIDCHRGIAHKIPKTEEES